MSTTPQDDLAAAPPRADLRRWAAGLFAAALIGLCVGLYLTRGGDPALEYNAPLPQLPNTSGLVDQGPLSTARDLAVLAGTRQEQEYARQAIELADHEVDQAFAAALHEATANPPLLTGAALKVSQRLAVLNPQIAAEQQQVDAFARGGAKPLPGSSAEAQEQLAEAQLALDQDERDDLQEDLVRLGGDRRSRIQQALDEHEALQKQSPQLPQNTAAAALESGAALRTIQGKLAALSSLNHRRTLLVEARAAAMSLAAQLGQKHDGLENATSTGTLVHPVSGAAQTSGAGSGAVLQLHALADQRKTLAQLDQRIHEEQQLAEVYARWMAQVELDRRTVLHRLFTVGTFLVILGTLMFGAHVMIRRELDRRIADRRRRNHLRVITEAGVQGVGAALMLLVLFGPPQQVSALLGLATAGIAFVMKDFVVAFFGWFVLMGRSGLRVGDLVEIQGVGGEVIELGLMRTVLLETGGGFDAGHPSGRRVAFMNSYAIEGRFFNFSTTGQWSWDELVINVASAEQAPQKAEAIRAAVEEETQADAAIAAAEWRQSRAGFAAPAATPSVSLRPATAGIDVIVHYVTRASEQYETRRRLYSRAIAILHFEGKGQEIEAQKVES